MAKTTTVGGVEFERFIQSTFRIQGGTYTMAEAEAAEAVRTIRPTVAIPMHYGYATGGDPDKFASLVASDATVLIL